MTDLSRHTKPSPRFECTTLCYYEGDTFALLLPIALTREGVPVPISPEDEITVTFVDRMGKTVAERRYTGIADSAVTVDWDAELTACFPRGTYTYRIRYNGECVTTIAADNRICVE